MNLNRIAKFEKVSFEQFKKDWIACFLAETTDLDMEEVEKSIRKIYDNIKLPERSTTKSAGHDIFSPCDYYIEAHSSILIPTGINCSLKDNLVLLIFPRSGLGVKNRFVPSNLVGVIDADYIDSQNQGHIFMKMVNEGDKDVLLKQGQAFCQGIIVQYFVADDDEVTSKRDGGFGSTDKI
jgi:dUTP pyrophosphatase